NQICKTGFAHFVEKTVGQGSRPSRAPAVAHDARIASLHRLASRDGWRERSSDTGGARPFKHWRHCPLGPLCRRSQERPHGTGGGCRGGRFAKSRKLVTPLRDQPAALCPANPFGPSVR